MTREHGFTLIEVLIVVAIIGIIATMGVGGLLRARAAANESSAIASLRTVTVAQEGFAASCGYGNFAATLVQLGAAPPGGSGYVSADLAGGLIVQKSGYLVAVGPSIDAVGGVADCNGTPTQTGYYASAAPVDFGGTGSRSFATASPMGAIWQDFAAIAPPQPFAAPAQPIQ